MAQQLGGPFVAALATLPQIGASNQLINYLYLSHLLNPMAHTQPEEDKFAGSKPGK
jgi:hypothetical protein